MYYELQTIEAHGIPRMEYGDEGPVNEPCQHQILVAPKTGNILPFWINLYSSSNPTRESGAEGELLKAMPCLFILEWRNPGETLDEF